MYTRVKVEMDISSSAESRELDAMHSYRLIDRFYREHVIPFSCQIANFPTEILYRATIDREKLANSSSLVNSVLNKSPVAINERGGTLMGNRNEQPVACEPRAQECSSFDLLNPVNIDAALEFTPCVINHLSSITRPEAHEASSIFVPKISKPPGNKEATETCRNVSHEALKSRGGASRRGRASRSAANPSRDTRGLRRSGALVGYQSGDSRRIHSWVA